MKYLALSFKLFSLNCGRTMIIINGFIWPVKANKNIGSYHIRILDIYFVFDKYYSTETFSGIFQLILIWIRIKMPQALPTAAWEDLETRLDH